MSDMYHYKQTATEADLEWKAPGIWTVGHYEGDQWQPESDHGSEKEAAARAQFLNGDPEAYGGIMSGHIMECESCGASTTPSDPRFGSLCDDCFDIEDQIGRGIQEWRRKRIEEQILPSLRGLLAPYTVWEYKEVLDALHQLGAQCSEEYFDSLLQIAKAEGVGP